MPIAHWSPGFDRAFNGAAVLGWPQTASERTIRLHGALAAAHGATHTLAVSSPSEALRALIYQVPGFEESLRKGQFQIFVNDDLELSMDEMGMNLGTLGTAIDIYPVVDGSKKGLGKILMGVLLIGLVIATGGAGSIAAGLGMESFLGATASTAGFWGTAGLLGAGTLGSATFMFGASMLMSGISSVLAPTPEVSDPVKDRPSFLFGSVVNTSQEGNVVPVMLGGPGFAGSAVISSEMDIQHFGSNGSPNTYAGGSNPGGGGGGSHNYGGYGMSDGYQ